MTPTTLVSDEKAEQSGMTNTEKVPETGDAPEAETLSAKESPHKTPSRRLNRRTKPVRRPRQDRDD